MTPVHTTSSPASSFQDRSTFTTLESIQYLWRQLGLPEESLQSLSVSSDETPCLPSSFRIGHLAQASIALSGLLASQIHALRNSIPPPTVDVPLQHAVAEFQAEQLYTINGQPPPSLWGPIGGLHEASDGHVRVHDGYPHHREGTKALLGCGPDASREAVASKILPWCAVDLESTGVEAKLVIAALRSYEQWDVHPQSKAIADFPILLRKLSDSPAPPASASTTPNLPAHLGPNADKCLRGLRVLELSRVIAAPVAGKTLAAHGADVLWVTNPNLPNAPNIDREFSRGKRTIQLDLQTPADHDSLLSLLDDADVFIQGYRPGSIAARNSNRLSPASLAKHFAARPHRSHGLIYANLSAYGSSGPWSTRRGFDSLVQTCSGMNVSEAQHFDATNTDTAAAAARPMPCQALDHASGYFLAAGIMAALYKQATEGGSWQVDVSLAGTMKYLRSLGQYEGRSGFEEERANAEGVPERFMETSMTGFGEMKGVRHSAAIEGVEVGWDIMPKELGSDEKRWL